MGLAMPGAIEGGKAPVIAGIGPKTAPPVGKAPAPVRPPKGAAPKTPAGKVGAAKAAGTGLEPLINSSPASLGKLASNAAAKIYKPIMQNYNSQLSQAGGLAQKRTADVTAFGQWYGQQQAALAAQETTRQTALQGLLGQLGGQQSTTPQNGIQSTDGTNMNAPTGGAQQLGAAGNNAAQGGILSTNALSNASETNSSQNELTALGGAYNQNMMATISADLTKTDTAIEDAQSKAYTAEGTNAAKIDTNMTSYLNDQNKNVVGQNKNVITANYDQQQADTKALNAVVATVTALGHWTPALTAQYNAISSRLSGVAPTAKSGPTGNTVKGQALNQTAYEDVTKRLAVAATNAKTKDTNAIDTIKNQISAAEAGAKVTVSNAEAKYYASRSGLSVAQAKSDLVKAYAYAQHYGTAGGATGAGVVPMTTDSANTSLAKSAGYQSWISNVLAGDATATKGMVNPPKNQAQMRQYINTHYGAGGSSTAAEMWAAFDMHFYGALTPRTHQMMLNAGFPAASLKSYKIANPKTK